MAQGIQQGIVDRGPYCSARRVVPALVGLLLGLGISIGLARHYHCSAHKFGLICTGSALGGAGLGYLLGACATRRPPEEPAQAEVAAQLRRQYRLVPVTGRYPIEAAVAQQAQLPRSALQARMQREIGLANNRGANMESLDDLRFMAWSVFRDIHIHHERRTTPNGYYESTTISRPEPRYDAQGEPIVLYEDRDRNIYICQQV